MLRVINKLKVRYPDKFSNELASNRNLWLKRESLENQLEFPELKEGVDY